MGGRHSIVRLGPWLGLLAVGCASTQTWVADLPCAEPELRKVRGAQVVAYTTDDGVRHPFEGRGWMAGEQIVLARHAGAPRVTETPVGMPADTTIVLARDEVRSLEFSHLSPGAGFGLGFLSGATLCLAGLFITLTVAFAGAGY